MASQSPNLPAPKLPETMRCPETGRTLRRDVRPFTVAYKGFSKTVDLPGYYPEDDGESVHVGDDMAVTDEALRTLKEEVDRIPSQHTVRRIRKKLGLSQREASRILGGGPNAFEKYERGEVEPSRVMGNLLFLLDRHPELLNDLRGPC
ncbi:type II toxin-antitoxin system MqsA family antitoxin [Azospirillum rugosum]|uniref:HTH-type transcriptional regulator/antitoxin MqsA n=1 Tax=Azospirillum rugosum TaxID=416170 RepID=A0ABS4SKG3_9PROT|nr:type II toxin-antitoxin system MqsA family antitoxin [Azospirillum rugosum]MBP2293046.1 HTH-type transcriptional regulator/antitoxin MqsA [Azospirillum rugosum]MDQ0526595.1 HTH-type transcriptional regulator/antitoxin MqsA [Azospirillum rugosum]